MRCHVCDCPLQTLGITDYYCANDLILLTLLSGSWYSETRQGRGHLERALGVSMSHKGFLLPGILYSFMKIEVLFPASKNSVSTVTTNFLFILVHYLQGKLIRHLQLFLSLNHKIVIT